MALEITDPNYNNLQYNKSIYSLVTSNLQAFNSYGKNLFLTNLMWLIFPSQLGNVCVVSIQVGPIGKSPIHPEIWPLI